MTLKHSRLKKIESFLKLKNHSEGVIIVDERTKTVKTLLGTYDLETFDFSRYPDNPIIIDDI